MSGTLKADAPLEQIAIDVASANARLENIVARAEAIRKHFGNANWGFTDELIAGDRNVNQARDHYESLRDLLGLGAQAAQGYREHSDVGDETTVLDV